MRSKHGANERCFVCNIFFHKVGLSLIYSLAPGRFKFRLAIFKPILVNGGWGISYEIALRWMPQDLTDDKSTLVQVMTWCHQATSHYLSQCWPRSLSPNGITRPQWVNDVFVHYCSGSAGASVVAHGVALPLYRDCFLDLRLFNSPDLRRLVLCYCCQAWTLETVLGGNTALPRWWTARSIDADAKR